jgi:hypothetical protein
MGALIRGRCSVCHRCACVSLCFVVLCVCRCVCLQCPAASAEDGATYAVWSGQHRLCAVIRNIVKHQDFHTKFMDRPHAFKDNKQIAVTYFVLRPETPDFVLMFLLHSINCASKTKSTPNGVWEFMAVFP